MLSQNWACAMCFALWVSSIDFPPNFIMGVLPLFPKKEEGFQLNSWQGAEILAEYNPSYHIEIDTQLGMGFLFKTEGGGGGGEGGPASFLHAGFWVSICFLCSCHLSYCSQTRNGSE